MVQLSHNSTRPPSIDSLQVFIPYQVSRITRRASEAPIQPSQSIIIKDTRLTDTTITIYNSTGEVHSIREHQPFTIEQDGITTGYRLYRQRRGKQTIIFISIGLTAKLLSKDYLQGITQDNIQSIYQSIINQNIIDISFNDFLESEVQLADIKRDTIHRDIQKAFQLIKSNLKRPNPNLKVHRNGNITIGSRKDTKQLYIKFYNKTQELKKNSSVFMDKHLHFQCPDNLLRTEITFSRNHLFDHFSTFQGTLESLLSSVQQEGANIIDKILLSETYFNREQQVPTSEPSSKTATKQDDQVRRFVRLCLKVQPPMTLPQVQEEVLAILKPGTNRRANLKRLTEYYFTQAQDELIHSPELLKALRIS